MKHKFLIIVFAVIYCNNILAQWSTNVGSSTTYTNNNVGIRTDEAASAFHIRGNGWVESLLTIERNETNGWGGGLVFISSRTDGSAIKNNIAYGHIFWKSSTGSNVLYSGAQISAFTTQDWNSTSAGTKMSFFTTANNTKVREERLTIDQNGYIGIGDPTPDYKLDVNGTINASEIRINGTPISTGGSSVWSESGTNAYYNGNVGIGTLSPDAKLEIISPVDNTPTVLLGRKSYYPTLKANSDANGWFIIESSGTGTGKIGLNYYNSDDILLANGGGDVGIGTSTPNFKLDVQGGKINVNAVGYHYNIEHNNDAGGNRSIMGVTKNGAPNFILRHNYNTGDITFDNYNSGDVIFEDYDVKVDKTNPRIFLDNTGTASDNVLFFQRNGNNLWCIRNDYSDTDKFKIQYQGNTDYFVINSEGNVGIGTTDPGDYKLAVEGRIGAREVKVTTDSWSDYVFAENYNLKTLNEVETFIQENNHLPDIPSEREVLENGIELGEMNKLLLQKIEELTLYSIEQNKMIEQLIQQNQKLEERVQNLEK